MGGHNRGDVALRVLSAGAMREMTIATGLGFVGALAWKFTVADATRARIQKTNKVSFSDPFFLSCCPKKHLLYWVSFHTGI